jgi:hypothetical protein
VASQATEEIPVHADLEDTSDASIDPRIVAAAPGAPSILEELAIEDLDRVDQAVSELEQIETTVEEEADGGVSDAVQAVPRLPSTPTEVRTRTEDRFDKNMYNGATTRVAAFLSRGSRNNEGTSRTGTRWRRDC